MFSFTRGTYLLFEGGNVDVPDVREREWSVNTFNFDDVPNAMLTLFTVSTFEGWPAYVFYCVLLFFFVGLIVLR